MDVKCACVCLYTKNNNNKYWYDKIVMKKVKKKNK